MYLGGLTTALAHVRAVESHTGTAVSSYYYWWSICDQERQNKE